jgi:cobalamin biosynthesis Mg chelatase CobN
MAKQTVALYTLTSGDRVERARTSLAEALGDAKLGDADDAGVFELSVDAESPEAARDLVREAFAKAGTGDDFVIREGTEGREIADDDPRQAGSSTPDPSSRVADAASAVAAAATGAAASVASTASDAAASVASSDAAESAKQTASEAADAAKQAASGAVDSAREAASGAAESAREAASGAADSAREAASDAASSVREAVDEKGVSGAASDYASSAASAAQDSPLRKFAPLAGLLVLLFLVRRARR